VRGDAESCPTCGERIARSPDNETIEPASAANAQQRFPYAGFWLRALALGVDFVIFCVALGPTVFEPIFRENHVGNSATDVVQFYTSGSRQATALLLLLHLILWLYFAGFESSPWQATPGKKLFRLAVTGLNGQRITFARASGRYFGSLLSQFFLIGYLMVGFMQRKQGLHDMLAGTLVLRKP
jgi:uncharacterized RDD family membrane protein YckC